MSKFNIEPMTDGSGNRHYVLYEHGMFHVPTALIERESALHIAQIIMVGSAVELPVVPDNFTIAGEVYATRKHKKQTQDKAAQEIGISRNYLVQIEDGTANMSLSIYRDIVYWMQKE